MLCLTIYPFFLPTVGFSYSFCILFRFNIGFPYRISNPFDDLITLSHYHLHIVLVHCHVTCTRRQLIADACIDVTTILHTASPINLSLARWEQVIVPALNGTLSIIASAYSHAGPQFEAFVLTSSLAAINDPSKSPYSFTEADWNDWAEAKAKEEGDAAPGGLLYVAAKTVAEKALWKFRDDKKVFQAPFPPLTNLQRPNPSLPLFLSRQ